MEIVLSILIATTTDRRAMFLKLYAELRRQSEDLYITLNWHTPPIEILFEEDNKEISIGKKRQKLLKRATGDYIVFFDSDDFPFPDYVSEIMTALEQKPDCVGMLIYMTTNGINAQTCCHSLKYKKWANNVDGYDYVRSVTIFNPVKRELALRAGFPDKRYGEDHDYSRKLTPLCKREVFIDKQLFHYRYTNHLPHAQKYGIKR